MKDDDGRHKRSEQSRAALIDALIGLVSGNNLAPTSNEIAARAGKTQRTLYGRFGSLDQLYADAAATLHKDDPLRWRLYVTGSPDRLLSRLEELESGLAQAQTEIESAINWLSTGADPVPALESARRVLGEVAGTAGGDGMTDPISA